MHLFNHTFVNHLEPCLFISIKRYQYKEVFDFELMTEFNLDVWDESLLNEIRYINMRLGFLHNMRYINMQLGFLHNM